MSDLRERREFDVGKIVWQVVRWLAALVLVAIVGLAFWPAKPSPFQADQSGAVQVPLKTGAIKRALAARQKVSVEFTEAELNGYLAVRARHRKLNVLTVDLRPGAFRLEAWMTWSAPFTNVTWLKHAEVPLSVSLTGGFEQGNLVVKRAHVGHLPLMGGAVRPIQAYFSGLFSDVVAEKLVVDSLTQVTLQETAVELKLGK
jgi:hypothetical protein